MAFYSREKMYLKEHLKAQRSEKRITFTWKVSAILLLLILVYGLNMGMYQALSDPLDREYSKVSKKDIMTYNLVEMNGDDFKNTVLIDKLNSADTVYSKQDLSRIYMETKVTQSELQGVKSADHHYYYAMTSPVGNIKQTEYNPKDLQEKEIKFSNTHNLVKMADDYRANMKTYYYTVLGVIGMMSILSLMIVLRK